MTKRVRGLNVNQMHRLSVTVKKTIFYFGYFKGLCDTRLSYTYKLVTLQVYIVTKNIFDDFFFYENTFFSVFFYQNIDNLSNKTEKRSFSNRKTVIILFV